MIVQQKKDWNLNIYLKTLLYFIFNWSVYPPYFQYKTWTSARVGVTDLKEFKLKLHTVYAVISEAKKPLQLVGQVSEFKFESKFEPLPVIWRSLRRLFQNIIEDLEGKINGQALGASLLLCLRGSDGRAQTQSAVVAAGRDRLG